MGKFLVILVFFMSMIAPSYQLTIKPTTSPITLNEHDPLTLKCIVASTTTTFQWLLHDEVVVSRAVGDSATTVQQGRNTTVYNGELIANNQGSLVFKVIILGLSRYDDGRWTCRTTSPEDEGRKVVEVAYKPDPQYPLCRISSLGRPTCTTQEGKPRVSLRWVDITGGNRETVRETENVANSAMMTYTSTTDPASVKPPADQLDSLTCEFEDGGPTRSCSFPKVEFFAAISVSITHESETIYNCNVAPPSPYFQKYLVWEWDGDELLGQQSLGVSGLRMTFENLDPSFNGTQIMCVLRWGIFNKEDRELLVVAPLITTRGPISTTTEHMTLSTSTERIIAVRPRDGNGGIIRSGNSDGENIDSGNEAIETSEDIEFVTGSDYVTQDSDAEELAGYSVTFLVVLLIIVFLVITVIIIIVVCVCSCGKDKPRSAVV